MAERSNGDGGSRKPPGAAGRNRNAYCSFCRRSHRDVGPLVEGPGDVYICGECIDLCQSIIDQERKPTPAAPRPSRPRTPSPRALKELLDQYVIGQNQAKRILSVAVHNHYKRLAICEAKRDDVELEKSNILLIGSNG